MIQKATLQSSCLRFHLTKGSGESFYQEDLNKNLLHMLYCFIKTQFAANSTYFSFNISLTEWNIFTGYNFDWFFIEVTNTSVF